jgi:predicted ATPase
VGVGDADRDRPTGTVSFLFTDVEGSTSLWERHASAMRLALARHDDLVRGAIEGRGGFVFSTAGDAFCAAFSRAADAVAAAIHAQRLLQAEPWPVEVSLRVRMGVHVGATQERDGDYFGLAVNRAARVMGLAHGGQVLVTLPVEELVRDELSDDVELVALGVHPLKGLSRPETLFQLVGPGMTREFPPLRAAGSRLGNLPSPPTAFVGRDDEIERLAVEIASRRVVTLVGPGGVGKTRLSIEAARAVRDGFPDGIWFVELGPISEAEAVQHAVASTLAVSPESGSTLLASIVDTLARRRALVVLDNCEHVIDAVAELVVAVVRAGPDGSNLLLSSREPLGVAGEQVLGVGALDTSGEAVELFCERARSIEHGFAPTRADLEVIAGICERLDGMPLAVELAAGRVRTMSLAQLADRLADRFRLLRSSARDAVVERHQTLRATVEWSYRLLNEDERLLFDRLSVFVGSFDLDAVEAVCTVHPLDALEVEELLGALVDKSLVALERRPEAMRYRLLETLREYGKERLAARSERERLLDAHMAHFVEQAELARGAFEGHSCLTGAQWFLANWDDLRAALLWAVQRDDHERGARLVEAATMFSAFWFRFELADWAQRVIPLATPGPALLGTAALFAAFGGESEHSLELANRGIATATDTDDPATLQCWHARLSVQTVAPGLGLDPVDAAEHMVASAERRPPEDRFCRAYAHQVAALMHAFARTGHYSEHLELAREAASSLDNALLDGYGEFVAGHVASAMGDKTRAIFHFEELARLADSAGSPHLRAMAPWSMAHVAPALTDQKAAVEAYWSSVDWLHNARDWLHLWPVVELLAGWWASNGALVQAAVIVGHLDAHHIATGLTEWRRQRTRASLAELGAADAALEHGGHLTRDQLIDYILHELDAAQ